MTTKTSVALSPYPAAEAVQFSLRQKITEGKLLPGSRLIDHLLADEYGVSRNTVRDALRLLSTDGLVVSVRNSGSSVRMLTAADVSDIYIARRLLETGGVQQSASASDALLAQVEDAVAASERHVRAGNWKEVGTASLGFHQCLVRLAGSQRLSGFFNILAAQLRLAFAVMPNEGAFQVGWIGRDRDIADLLLAGRRDEAAAQLISYLNESETQIIDAVRAAERRQASREPQEGLS